MATTRSESVCRPLSQKNWRRLMTHMQRKTILTRNIDDLKVQRIPHVKQYVLLSISMYFAPVRNKTGTLVVFHGAYKFEEIARIQILFDAGPKATVSSFKAASREATWNARTSRRKTFGGKFFRMIRLKRERKIRFAASGFQNFPPKSLDDERTSNRYLFAALSLSRANHPPI